MSNQPEQNRNPRIGLCEHCRFMRRIQSDRGSIFYMCLRSESDPNFSKYPRLPVLQCSGYEPQDAQSKASTH